MIIKLIKRENKFLMNFIKINLTFYKKKHNIYNIIYDKIIINQSNNPVV